MKKCKGRGIFSNDYDRLSDCGRKLFVFSIPQVVKMVRKAIKFPILSLLIVILLTGCYGGKGKRLPSSTGQPYEVVLEGDTANIVSEILTEDVPALPQSEPLCNVISVKRGKAKGCYSTVRTRIVVDIDKRHEAFSAKAYKDANASPQLVIRIRAKSAEQLRTMLYDKDGQPNGNAQKLRTLIDQSELQHLAATIKQNPEKQREVKRMFGIDMKIPLSMDASKKGKGFFWLSNNANTGMQNILIFRVNREERRTKKEERKRKNETFATLQQQVDSILQKNMPGETDSMYMTIPHIAERGLWQMKGDAMGGPYVMRTKGDIAVIAFVYAPEKKKRNLTKQLEAVLTTIK